MVPPPPRSTLFPYTTLFRSLQRRARRNERPRCSITAVVVRVSCESLAFSAVDLAPSGWPVWFEGQRSEEHTSELQSRLHLVCRLLLEKKKKKKNRKSNNNST